MSFFHKFVFFGTPEFAVVVLQKLIDSGFTPAAVVCNPDRPVGRKKIITPPPVKQWLKSQEPRAKENIEILQPKDLTAISYKLKAIQPEFAVVAAYAKIIPKEIIDLFPRGMLGVHPSLLPKYRGATPIQSAILDGATETGVTLYLLDEKVDHGRVVSSVKCQVSSSDNYQTLMEKLANLGGELLAKTIPDFVEGKIKHVPQDETSATYTKKFSAEDAFVPSEALKAALHGDKEKAVAVDRKIRALNPEPGTWTTQAGKRVKLLEAHVAENRLILEITQREGEKPKNF